MAEELAMLTSNGEPHRHSGQGGVLKHQSAGHRHRHGPRLAIFFLLILAVRPTGATAESSPHIPPGFLAYPPYNGFVFDAMHLVPERSDNLNVVEKEDYALKIPVVGFPYDAPSDERRDLKTASIASQAKSAAVPDRISAQVKAMTFASDGDAAYATGVGVTEVFRLYTAATVDFRLAHAMVARDEQSKAPPGGPMDAEQRIALHRAIGRFQAILALPDAERAPRAVAAAYMLGRCYELLGGADDVEKAENAFVLTRSLARKGLVDPDGLAVASFGDQGYLRRGKGDLASAVGMYAEQAVRGSAEGVASLKWVAQGLFLEPDGTAKTENIPLAQIILITYALELHDNAKLRRFTYIALDDRNQLLMPWDIDRGQGLAPILTVIRQWPRTKIARPDLVAALAYRMDDIEFARSLLDEQQTPLAWWLRAKIWVHDGNLAEAESAYHKTLEISLQARGTERLSPFNVVGACLEMTQVERVRGEFLRAANDMMDCDRRFDEFDSQKSALDYVTTSIMTTSEMIAFVNSLTPDPHREGLLPTTDRVDLRSGLARRLVFENRIAEAIPYADANYEIYRDPSTTDTSLDDGIRTQRDLILAYQRAMDQSRHAASAVERASGWYRMAVITRAQDYEVFGQDTGVDPSKVAPQFPGFSDGELKRLRANAAIAGTRDYHWFRAYDEALKAASLVPPRSQAYAAILCHAAHWMYQAPGVDHSNASASFSEPWRLYLAHGAFVPWAKTFGHTCPDPDFEAAARPAWKNALRDIKTKTTRHATLGVSLLCLLVLGAALVGWRLARSARDRR